MQIVLVSDGLQWSKTIRVTKDMTGKDLLSSVRERVKAEGVKIPPVELQNLSLHLPAAAGTWIEEKKKLGKYKLADGVRFASFMIASRAPKGRDRAEGECEGERR